MMNMLRFIICVGVLIGVYGYNLKDRDNEVHTETRGDLSACKCQSDIGCACQGSDGELKVIVAFAESAIKAGQDSVIWAYFKVGNFRFTKRFTVRTLDGFCRTIKGKTYCFELYQIEVYGKVHGCVSLTKPKKIDLGCFSLPIA